MILIDLKQQLLIPTQLQPTLKRMQQLVPIGSENMICLMDLSLLHESLPRFAQRVRQMIKATRSGSA